MKNSVILVFLVAAVVPACKTMSSQSGASESAAPAAAPSAPITPNTTSVIERGRELTSLFYKGETSQIWPRMTPEMKSALRSEQNLSVFRQQVESQLGTETGVIDEKTAASPPYQVYLRKVSFSKFDKPVNVQWALDEEGNIAGFFVKPAE